MILDQVYQHIAFIRPLFRTTELYAIPLLEVPDKDDSDRIETICLAIDGVQPEKTKLDQIYKQAINIVKEQHPHILLILEGSESENRCREPQNVIMAPTKKILNKLDAIDKRMTKLKDEIKCRLRENPRSFVSLEEEEQIDKLIKIWRKEISDLAPRLKSLKKSTRQN